MELPLICMKRLFSRNGLTKITLYLFFIAFCFVFNSCTVQNEPYRIEGNLKIYQSEEFIVCSELGYYYYDFQKWPYYKVRRFGENFWSLFFTRIDGLNYVENYEYRILAERIEDLSQSGLADGSDPYEYLHVLKVISSRFITPE